MLSLRHENTVTNWFENGGNKRKAMLDAGYSRITAIGRPDLVFNREDVKAEIAKRKKRLAKKYDLSQEWVIERLMDLAMSGETLAKYKIVQPDGTLAWDFEGATWEELKLVQDLGVEFYTEGRGDDAKLIKKFKVKQPDEQAALIALARHLSLFNDTLELKGSMGARIQSGRNRIRAKNAETDGE